LEKYKRQLEVAEEMAALNIGLLKNNQTFIGPASGFQDLGFLSAPVATGSS